MKKNADKKTSAKGKVQEPAVHYESRVDKNNSTDISFSSHKEEEEEMLQYSANLTPEQRLQNLYKLICISFGLNTKELRNPKLNNKIIFENPDEHFS